MLTQCSTCGSNPVKARGLCLRCYGRARYAGTLPPRVHIPLATRHAREVDTSAGPDACWPWLGGKTDDGYGRLEVQGRKHGAHRVAWELANGPIPAGMLVCHSCDNPACVNPAHLWLGDAAANMADRDAKGRQARGERTRPETRARGERHGNAKLTADQAREIYRRGRSGTTEPTLAREYGVSVMVVSAIKRRQAWRHATDPLASLP